MHSTHAAPSGKKPFNIERLIKLYIDPTDDGFDINTEGMQALGKPELMMKVTEGWYLSSACRIMNDTARYIVSRDKNPQTGQRVQLAPWTVVEFMRSRNPETELETLALKDGSAPEFFS